MERALPGGWLLGLGQMSTGPCVMACVARTGPVPRLGGDRGGLAQAIALIPPPPDKVK